MAKIDKVIHGGHVEKKKQNQGQRFLVTLLKYQNIKMGHKGITEASGRRGQRNAGFLKGMRKSQMLNVSQ